MHGSRKLDEPTSETEARAWIAAQHTAADPYLMIAEATERHRVEHGCEAYASSDGPLLGVLARAVGATRILEVGTAFGYTAAWLAHGAAGGIVDTIEVDATHAEEATAQLRGVGLADRVRVHVGRFPDALAFDGARLWVANSGDNSVQSINPTTGVASSNSNHCRNWADPRRSTGSPTSGAMANTTTGTANSRLPQKRRVMSTSSGFASSSTATVVGSSAMPHLGHAPGSDATTSGCMGQTYWVVGPGSVSSTLSSPMPQLGQAPGSSCWTSGHIEQVYMISPSTEIGWNSYLRV